MAIYDCFTFFREFEMLELRLHELDECVNYFVIVEATKTQQGLPKELFFEKNKSKFNKFKNKIIHIIVDDFPEKTDAWTLENFQRNAIMRAIEKANPEDYIIISDVDEIPSKDAIKNFRGEAALFEMDFYSYYANNFRRERYWKASYIIKRKYINNKNTPQMLREKAHRYKSKKWKYEIIKNGGWHFSSFGGKEAVRQKTLATVEGCGVNIPYEHLRILEILRDQHNIWLFPMPKKPILPDYLTQHKEKFSSWFKDERNFLSADIYQEYFRMTKIVDKFGIDTKKKILAIDDINKCADLFFKNDEVVYVKQNELYELKNSCDFCLMFSDSVYSESVYKEALSKTKNALIISRYSEENIKNIFDEKIISLCQAGYAPLLSAIKTMRQLSKNSLACENVLTANSHRYITEFSETDINVHPCHRYFYIISKEPLSPDTEKPCEEKTILLKDFATYLQIEIGVFSEIYYKNKSFLKRLLNKLLP